MTSRSRVFYTSHKANGLSFMALGRSVSATPRLSSLPAPQEVPLRRSKSYTDHTKFSPLQVEIKQIEAELIDCEKKLLEADKMKEETKREEEAKLKDACQRVEDMKDELDERVEEIEWLELERQRIQIELIDHALAQMQPESDDSDASDASVF